MPVHRRWRLFRSSSLILRRRRQFQRRAHGNVRDWCHSVTGAPYTQDFDSMGQTAPKHRMDVRRHRSGPITGTNVTVTWLRRTQAAIIFLNRQLRRSGFAGFGFDTTPTPKAIHNVPARITSFTISMQASNGAWAVMARSIMTNPAIQH